MSENSQAVGAPVEASVSRQGPERAESVPCRYHYACTARHAMTCTAGGAAAAGEPCYCPCHTDTAATVSELNCYVLMEERHIANGNTSKAEETREYLLGITRLLDEHPDNYAGPCECNTCVAYMAEDHS